MNKKLFFLVVIAACIAGATSCKKDTAAPVIIPSDGTSQTLAGGAGGSSATNSVFLDLSTDKQDTAVRSSWDLGFNCGTDFRVRMNNTTSAGIKVTTFTDLAALTAADTIGLTLATSQAAPAATDFAYFDAIDGAITGTAIPEIAATGANNKVIVLNRGTGGATASRPWVKLKITRNAPGGYTIQYGGILQTTGFTSIDISKDAAYNFKFLSLTSGALVNVEPKKADWDFSWGYSVYQTNFGTGLVPYNFSDLIFTNTLAGVQSLEIKYATADIRNAAYATFNKDSVSKYTLLPNRDVIGSNWRETSGSGAGSGGAPPPGKGVLTDRFYVLKDVAGNYYKIKFISMGVNDGGVRGKPVVEYKLLK